MAAGEHAQILQNNRLEQRCHEFVRRSPDFLQAVDIGFSKYAAFAGHSVQFDSVVSLFAKLGGRNFQLGIDFVDNRARAACTLVVHRRDFLLPPGFLVVLEDDNFRVLASQFNDGINLGMHLLHRERNRGDFLHELGANLLGNRATPGAGHEHASVVAINSGVGFHAAQKFQRLLRLLGLVALIVLP